MAPMPQPGDVSPGFIAEAGRCWRMLYDRNLQATHCDERPGWTGRWRSPGARPLVGRVGVSRSPRRTYGSQGVWACQRAETYGDAGSSASPSARTDKFVHRPLDHGDGVLSHRCGQGSATRRRNANELVNVAGGVLRQRVGLRLSVIHRHHLAPIGRRAKRFSRKVHWQFFRGVIPSNRWFAVPPLVSRWKEFGRRR